MEPVVGSCFYTCNQRPRPELYEVDISDLNNEMCRPFNRNGTMCGQCIEGHGLPVYSYNLSCVECTDYKYNWLKYIAVAYGPLTLFYFFIIIFRVSANSGSMVGYVTISQVVSNTYFNQIYLGNTHYMIIIRLFVLFNSIWNLDFFRSLYPLFCLHPHLSALQVLSLDYIVAVYPMILVLLTYLLVKLHDRFTLVVWMCRPINVCLRCFRKEWDVKNSLIGAFATLVLLSYVKILNVTAGILTPAYLYYMNGTHSSLYVFNDINTPYLSRKHLPYFITAILMSSIFNIIPLLLLCLYPCHCFQRFLNSTRLYSQMLHTFMDAQQGCYKHRPRDFRFFPAIYLTMQIANFLVFYFPGLLQYHTTSSYIWMIIIASLLMTRPYKVKWHNIVNIVLFTTLFLAEHAFIVRSENFYHPLISHAHGRFWGHFNSIVMVLSLCITSFYGLTLGILQTLPSRFKVAVKMKILNLICRPKNNSEESLPYRLRCDRECDPLINK